MERWSVFSDFRREPIVGVVTSPSKQVVSQLNERPRKALGIETPATPAERFSASVASTGWAGRGLADIPFGKHHFR
jgi:hypothetical protein